MSIINLLSVSKTQTPPKNWDFFLAPGCLQTQTLKLLSVFKCYVNFL